MSASQAVLSAPFRRILVSAAAAGSVITLGLMLYILVVPARTLPALRWYLLIIGTIGIIAAIRAITARHPVLWRSSAGRPARVAADELPQRLRAIDRLVTRAGWDAAGFQLELRPILRTIAAQRLATYRTINIDANPTAARAELGERIWSLLTPVNLETAREEKGIGPDDLRAAVERLEGLDVNLHA